jgi:hypothetical protein
MGVALSLEDTHTETSRLSRTSGKEKEQHVSMARTLTTELGAAAEDANNTEEVHFTDPKNNSSLSNDAGSYLATVEAAESLQKAAVAPAVAGSLLVSSACAAPASDTPEKQGTMEQGGSDRSGSGSAGTTLDDATDDSDARKRAESRTEVRMSLGRRLRRPPPLQVTVAATEENAEPTKSRLVLLTNAENNSVHSGTTNSTYSQQSGTLEVAPLSVSTSATSRVMRAEHAMGTAHSSSIEPQSSSSASSGQQLSVNGFASVPFSESRPATIVGAAGLGDGSFEHGAFAAVHADARSTHRRRDVRRGSHTVLPPPLPPLVVEPAVHLYIDALPAMPPKSPLPGSARGALQPVGHASATGSCHSAGVIGTYNLLHPFTRRGNFQIRHGEVIYKGHRSYHLMMQIKAGIRYTVERQNALAPRNLCMADFRTSNTIRFPAVGSSDTPPIEKCFTFKDYAPMVFRQLRQRYGISPTSYLRSLCGEEALREATTAGKSGSLFYYSSDDRFILKTLSKQEASVLLSILPQYYFHMMKNPESLITRFFGLHRVTTHRLGLRRRRIRMVVMSNFLPTRTPIHLRYDLKGSTHGRFSRTPASHVLSNDDEQQTAPQQRFRPSLLCRASQELDPRQPRKDLDLFRDGVGPIAIDRRLRRRMLNQIDMDCLFLESVHIMDYSFLLGLQYVDTSANLPVSAESWRRLRERDARHANSWVGLLENGEEARLFFGIIDVLDRYNAEKKLEHFGKAHLLCLHDSISVIEPSSYARRFRRFLEKVFVPVPRSPYAAVQDDASTGLR